MAEYANENSEKFIPDKKCERSILVEVAEARKLKSWMIFYWSYLSKRKKTVDITIDSTFEKNLRLGNKYYKSIVQITDYD